MSQPGSTRKKKKKSSKNEGGTVRITFTRKQAREAAIMLHAARFLEELSARLPQDVGYLSVDEMKQLRRQEPDYLSLEHASNEEDTYMSLDSVRNVTQQALDAGYLSVEEMQKLCQTKKSTQQLKNNSNDEDEDMYMTVEMAHGLTRAAVEQGYLTVAQAQALMSGDDLYMDLESVKPDDSFKPDMNAEDFYLAVGQASGHASEMQSRPLPAPPPPSSVQPQPTKPDVEEEYDPAKAEEERRQAFFRRVEKENLLKREIYAKKLAEEKAQEVMKSKKAKEDAKRKQQRDKEMFKMRKKQMADAKKEMRQRSSTQGKVDMKEVMKRSAALAAGLRETSQQVMHQEKDENTKKWESTPTSNRLICRQAFSTQKPGFVHVRRGDRLIAIEMDVAGYHTVMNLRTGHTGMIPATTAVVEKDYKTSSTSDHK